MLTLRLDVSGVKAKSKIFCGVTAILALTYVISVIPNFRHRAKWNQIVAALCGKPREHVNSAIQAFAGAQKAQGRLVPDTVSLRELVASGFVRAEDAAPFGSQDATFATSVGETNPQQVIARVLLPSGLAVIELAD